jgi:hypothetical protein
VHRQGRLPSVRLACACLQLHHIQSAQGAASGIEGRGLFAVAPIAADELVAIKGGHIVTTATLRSLPEHLRRLAHQPDQRR